MSTTDAEGVNLTGDSSIADDAIGVVGMGCWYPDAPSPARLWENVLARRRAFRRLPAGRLSLESYFDADPGAPDKTYGRRAAVIEGFDFDWIARRIPRSTFEATDISHWLALEVALQALGDAGYSRDTLPRERTGVIVGNTLTGEQSRSKSLRVRWPFVERAIRAAAAREGLLADDTEELVRSTQSYFKSVFPRVDEDTLAGSLSNTIAGRICNFLDLQGGGFTVDGACASSLLAVTTAANVLCSRDLDLALVGGVDISLDPFELVGFAKVGALSPTEMRVYDRSANGFLPGEGCGFVVLKRLSDARADHDYVYATLRGWGVSSDGAGGLTAPSVRGQAFAIRRAYKRAGYSPELLHFVEGHGTGTPVGDPVELKAIAEAMKSYGVEKPRSCGITSFKSIVGHTKAAAGVGGFIKATIAVNRRVIPPTAGCVRPNPTFDDAARVLYPVRDGEIESPESVVRAGVSAMGFGGINTHVTLESGDPPASRLRPSLDEEVLIASAQATELFAISAESIEGMLTRLEEVSFRGDGMSIGELPDFAAQLSREARPDGRVRVAIVASDPDELEAHVRAVLDALRQDAPAEGTARRCTNGRNRAWIANTVPRARIGFLFPGQGAQRLGMARQLVRRFDWAKRFADQADEWMIEAGHEPITPFMFRPLDRALGDDQVLGWRDALRETRHAQPAICLASVLWLKCLARLGVSPDVVAGHSLGELSAFRAAGVIDDRTLLQLASARARVMADIDARGTMASLSCGQQQAEGLIARVDGYCVVANLNAPQQTVVSGDQDAVERVVQAAQEQSITAVRLDVSGAFHSAHFLEAAASLREADCVPVITEPLQTPMLSAVDGSEIRTGVALGDYLARQMCAKVDFVTLARSMTERCDVMLELGPGRVLSGLMQQTVADPHPLCFPIESSPGKDEDLNVALAALFAHGHRLRLEALYDSRLCRPFVPAAERIFIANPCEQPFATEPDHALRPATPKTARVGGTMIPPSPALRDSSHEAPYRVVAESQVVPKPSVGGAVLARVEAQTGFPKESLTLDLRLVDDLHLDSIKTVELVADVAEDLGLVEEFDAAQFADATLGELVERIEALEHRSNTVGSAIAAGGLAEAEPEAPFHAPGVSNFAVHWLERALPPSSAVKGLLGGRTLVLAPDTTDPWVETFLGDLNEQGVDAHGCNAGDLAATEAAFDHLLVVCPEDPASGDSETLPALLELLTCASRLLPTGVPAGGSPCCVGWIRTRLRETRLSNCMDWSLDGFAATVHLERRQIRVRSLEFVLDDQQQVSIATSVVREFAERADFGSARYDPDGRRFISMPRLQDPVLYSPRANKIEADDVVLVTGGAKGITAQCALALARETRATMVLVGSSPRPDADSVGAGADEIRQTLTTFNKEGLRCSYHQCNLAVEEDVKRLVATVRSEQGSLDAVVHGAGLNHPRRIGESTAAQAFSEIAPKLVGALNLFTALDDEPPKMFVALTSIIGVIGMPHNAWYAFANQSLDRSLGRFSSRHPSVAPLSLAYSIWDEVGMGAKLGSIERLARLGIDAIPVEEGAARFVELVTHDPGSREVIVTARMNGVDTWKPVMSSLVRSRRFVDQTVALEPNREIICRTKLDLETDPYLRDHVYQGSHLVPAVFGLEAMAQAVAQVTGRPEIPFPLLIENVELTRPLVVHPDRGLEIEIRAFVAPSTELASEGQAVRAEIRCAQTGFQRAHFAATFVLGASVAIPDAGFDIAATALPLHPKQHLYGSVLFQGPRFQRIAELRALDAKTCVFAATRCPSDDAWVLGDPYFRDALLQSLQLCVIPDQCLPVRVERWRIIQPEAFVHETKGCKATIEGKEGDTYIGTVSAVGEDGTVVESLSGYRARTLLRRPDWPEVTELAQRGATPLAKPIHIMSPSETRVRVNDVGGWDGSVFYRDVPGYGIEGQTAFFCRFPLSAQDSSSVSGSLNFTSYFRWAGKLREWGGMNTPGVYQGILEMLGSNAVMSATNECETRIIKVPQRNDLIEGRYWMEYVNKGDAGNIFEWWRIPFPSGEPEMIAWTRMRISAVKAVQHGVITSTDWPEFLYRFLKDMGDDAPRPTEGPELKLDLGECLFLKTSGPRPGPWLAEQVFTTSQEDSNVVGNIYFANYSVWQGRLTDSFFHSCGPHLFEDRGARGEIHRAETRISQLRDAVPFDEIKVVMRLEGLYERGAQLSFDFFREQAGGETMIAAGRHLVAWAKVKRGAEPRPIEWPKEIRDALLARANEPSILRQNYA